jgi:AcrR family transcriptional regulator
MEQSAARRPRRLPREERIHDIVSSARQAFSEKGYEKASMAYIAQRAGIAEGTIYKFFDSKRTLLISILRAWYRDMIDDIEAKLDGVDGTHARLRMVIWQHLTIIRDHPDLCRLFYTEVRSHADYRGSELFTLNREVTRMLVSVLKEGVRSGDLRHDVDVRLLRDMIFGGIEHHSSRYLASQGDLDVVGLADALADIVVNGIATAPAGRTPDVAIRLERAVDRLERTIDRTASS